MKSGDFAGVILCIGVLKIDTPGLKKHLASWPHRRPNTNREKSPSDQVTAVFTAPGQEGLSDYM